MATYAVGDIQGCIKPLKCLLKQVSFNWEEDRLWLVGDLVNRGPDSLKTLRYVYKHRDRITMVLGNHDLHLLAVANGLRKKNRFDTLDKLLLASDREELLDWLRQQPLMHSAQGYTLVHAGLPPMWTLAQAHNYAREVETALRGPDYRKFLASMYGDTPRRWKESLCGYDRLRLITNYLTRMRFVYPNGSLDMASKGSKPNPGCKVAPWFSDKGRETKKERLIFGHWAALEGRAKGKNLYPTDTGCVWGGKLSMYCLDNQQWHSCDCN
ncbi:MAG: symmetrical bis(5'-nucleosyl)-tetraphosphatase [Gammaproteobacteria bacterium]|nr:symmetrical bis(5'-nucleosyl)-tetraphosphatase [Gammaproteobacteria bacterium]